MLKKVLAWIGLFAYACGVVAFMVSEEINKGWIDRAMQQLPFVLQLVVFVLYIFMLIVLTVYFMCLVRIVDDDDDEPRDPPDFSGHIGGWGGTW